MRLPPPRLAPATSLCLLLSLSLGAQSPRDERALELAARLPVQDGGRVKPLSTRAAFTLLGIHHRRSFRDPDGSERGATAWLLRVILQPEAAREDPLFLVENDEVLDALGLDHEARRKRDTYSLAELAPARQRLWQLANEYRMIEERDRSPVQGQIVRLDHALRRFERDLAFLDFARSGVQLEEEERRLFDGARTAPVSEVLRRAEKAPWPEALRQNLLRRARQRASSATALALIPPASPEESEWRTPRDVVEQAALSGASVDALAVDVLAALEQLWEAREDPAARLRALEMLSASVLPAAKARGEYERIPLEVFFYRLDPFFHALVVYLISFLLAAVGWTRPQSRLLQKVALGAVLGAFTLHVGGIALRCVLRGRPPASTLYETVLFACAVAVGTALALEFINRRRVALSASALLGLAGMWIARRYEVIDGVDTMPQLVAVLDTNFWLSTHVTCITIGYAAGLLASAFAHLQIFTHVFGFRRKDRDFHRGLARMSYGVLCFALVFSVVGTILGGIWANESWGRFWGWDPKENGALMIVLSQLAILHARLGGLLRAHGLALAMVASGCVIAFSWWGVNLLGIGLHSYGFTRGVANGLTIFYSIEAGVLLFGLVGGWLRGRVERSR